MSDAEYWRVRCESAERERDEALAEVARCHARLEIDHVWKAGKNGEWVRIEVPMAERYHASDGISCRDDTIQLTEEALSQARAELEGVRAERGRLREALVKIVHEQDKQDDWDRRSHSLNITSSMARAALAGERHG